ncbi:MAG: phenol hydroxylase [Gammaproteobacteria bacterium]|jgi:phenol hydroxylase P1 protein|nr:MAG: phenol hydroxylase [Gammaproteobacteria bacterium]PHR82766.1 MAG: phenol hydroxylase [Colwellia sp.]
MSVHISTKEIKTKRTNYGYVGRRIGHDKPASRYQEAVYDLQPTTNFHYPPTWAEGKELYDVRNTSIVMEDWYSFTDPRQFYYSAYVMARAKQQESMDNNFKMAEKHKMLLSMPDELKASIKKILTPLRHVEYGANMNNQDICDRGYGSIITSLASLHGFDRIGISQYISKIILLIDENESVGLEQGRIDWLDASMWQPLRHAMEDIFVLDDWFEIMVAQNIVMDGLIYPLIFDQYIQEVSSKGGNTLTLLTQFMSDWYVETIRWTNQLIKVVAKESDANNELLSSWVIKWTERLNKAVLPIAQEAFTDGGKDKLEEAKCELLARLAKQGLKI